MFRKIGIAVTVLFVVNTLSKVFVEAFAKSVRKDDPNIDANLEDLDKNADELRNERKWRKFYQAELAQSVIEYMRETERNSRNS